MRGADRDRPKIIRVVRKKRGHGAHHGGSWKVAYADFVTALMAFFLVMWIVGMDQNVKKAVEGYFSNPVGYKHGYGSGRSPISSGNAPAGMRDNVFRTIAYMREQQAFAAARAAIVARLEESRVLGTVASHVEIVITQSGLRIELVEGDSGSVFFDRGSAHLTRVGLLVVGAIGEELSALSNPVVVEGHTDAAVYGEGGYSNWELSTDRANAARRILQASGVAESRVASVSGMADRDLRDPAHPLSAANRRVTIVLPFQNAPPDDPAEHGGPAAQPVAPRPFGSS